MLILVIVVIIILIWLYRRKQDEKKLQTLQTNEVKNFSLNPNWTNSKSLQLRSDLQGRNSNVSKNETDFAEEDLGTYLLKPRNLYQPDSVANSGRINYGAAVLFDNAPGLSSGEIEGQLPLVSRQNLMKEQQHIRNIDLQRRIFYGGSTSNCTKDQYDAMTYPKYVWQNPTSKNLRSFPEDSPFDPIIPFHL